MTKNYDVTALIERLEVFEERLGVALEALSASVEIRDSGMVVVRARGELHSRNGAELQNDIRLQVGVYDTNGRLVGGETKSIFKNEFFGLELFMMTIISQLEFETSKIRVFPQKQ